MGTCPACHSAGLETFHEVRGVPVNTCLLVETRTAALAFPTGDILLSLCPSCGFITNAAFEPARTEYSASYEETQGFSPRFRAFASELAEDLVRRYHLAGREVLEIGCGKGEFLALLCELGALGTGIDPSYHPGRLATTALDRMRVIRDFYGPSYRHLTADLICCRHTLEHIGPVAEFVEVARASAGARPGSAVFFEVPDVTRVLREVAFWDIYYEHCSYFGAGSLTRLFEERDFGVTDVTLAFEGQYLLLHALPGARTGPPRGESVGEMRRAVDEFTFRYADELQRWRDIVEGLRGRRPVVWGSGSKAVAWLTTLGIAEEIELVVDINPHKWGKFLAGTGHEIVGPDALVEYRPEAVIVMNSAYCGEIRTDLEARGLRPALLSV